MDLSVSSRSLSRSPSPSISPFNSKRMILKPVFHKFSFDSRNFKIKPLVSRQNRPAVVAVRASNQNVRNDGFVLEDVHLTNFLPHLPCVILSLRQTFVSPEDAVAQKIVIRKDSPRGVHFLRAGPREKSDEVCACIVTCGRLCLGINTVIREIVCGLSYMYGVDDILGIEASATDWKFGAKQFIKRLPDKVFVHCCKRNMSKLTLDGLHVMGEHFAQEVLEVIERKPNLQKISFVAHSVGDLVARYAIGKLYRPPKIVNGEDSLPDTSSENSRGTIVWDWL